MATQYTYDSGGSGTTTIREELADIIAIMSPMDTPLHNLLEQVPVGNTTFEWMVDEIATPTTVNAQLEGATPSAANRTRQRLRNVCMIDHLGIDVSDTQRTVEEAGISDEFSYQIVHKSLELLKRMEHNLHWSMYQAGSSGTARQTAGLMEWIAGTGQGRDAQSETTIAGISVPVEYSSSWYEADDSAFSEADFRDSVIQPAWRNGMQISQAIAMCGGKVKQIISDFSVTYGSGSSTVNAMFIEAEKKKKVLTVDVYETDYGPLSVALNRYMDSSSVTATIAAANLGSSAGGATVLTGNEVLVLIEPEFWQIGTLRALQYAPLAKTGDSEEGYVVAEEGLRCLNPIAGAGAGSIP